MELNLRRLSAISPHTLAMFSAALADLDQHALAFRQDCSCRFPPMRLQANFSFQPDQNKQISEASRCQTSKPHVCLERRPHNWIFRRLDERTPSERSGKPHNRAQEWITSWRYYIRSGECDMFPVRYANMYADFFSGALSVFFHR